MISQNQALFNFKVLSSADALNQHQNGLDEMQNGHFDGMIIKSIVTPQACQLMIDYIEREHKAAFFEDSLVRLFPLGFAAVSSITDRQLLASRLSLNTDMLAKQQEFFGMPIVDVVTETISKITNNRPVEIAPAGNGLLTPTQYRRLLSSRQGFPVHCGNAFEKLAQPFYRLMAQDVDSVDQLSYFIVLQNTEVGGELTLYNHRWHPSQQMHSQHTFINEQGIEVDSRAFDAENKMSIKPEVGDMLIFEGGNIWHKVEPILGASDRITVGGFIGYSHSRQKVYIWS